MLSVDFQNVGNHPYKNKDFPFPTNPNGGKASRALTARLPSAPNPIRIADDFPNLTAELKSPNGSEVAQSSLPTGDCLLRLKCLSRYLTSVYRDEGRREHPIFDQQPHRIRSSSAWRSESSAAMFRCRSYCTENPKSSCRLGSFPARSTRLVISAEAANAGSRLFEI